MAGTKEVAQLVTRITGLTQKTAVEAVNAVLDSIQVIAEEGELVTFRNYGTFRMKTAKARKCVNPAKPGEMVDVPEKTRLTFKAAK